MTAAIPVQPVTCQIYDQAGLAVHGARIRFELTTVETYGGLVVPDRIEAVTGPTGSVVLAVFPNALGVASSQYRVTAWHPETGERIFAAVVTVPDSPCNLHSIISQPPYPAVDAAQQALEGAQAAQAAAETSANAASGFASAAQIAMASVMFCFRRSRSSVVSPATPPV